MSLQRHGRSLLLLTLVVLTGCADVSRWMDGSLGVVEVLETPPPIAVVIAPPPPPVRDPSIALVSAPEPVYLQPLPQVTRHTVRAHLEPSGARRLDAVQSIEVEVEIEGGSYGTREISAVFVSPQGLVWERKGMLIDGKPGEAALAHFSLPVAATFIEEQRLSGTWQINTLDEGLEQASASVELLEVTP